MPVRTGCLSAKLSARVLLLNACKWHWRRYSQKPLLRREISNGLYHYSSFFIAKSLTSLPFQLMFACIFTGSVYFLVRKHLQTTLAAVASLTPLSGCLVLLHE